MTPLRLFFIRHGECVGNLEKRNHFELADHAIPLTELGRQQAYASGEWLGWYFLDHNTTETKTDSGSLHTQEQGKRPTK